MENNRLKPKQDHQNMNNKLQDQIQQEPNKTPTSKDQCKPQEKREKMKIELEG